MKKYEFNVNVNEKDMEDVLVGIVKYTDKKNNTIYGEDILKILMPVISEEDRMINAFSHDKFYVPLAFFFCEKGISEKDRKIIDEKMIVEEETESYFILKSGGFSFFIKKENVDKFMHEVVEEKSCSCTKEESECRVFIKRDMKTAYITIKAGKIFKVLAKTNNTVICEMLSYKAEITLTRELFMKYFGEAQFKKVFGKITDHDDDTEGKLVDGMYLLKNKLEYARKNNIKVESVEINVNFCN